MAITYNITNNVQTIQPGQTIQFTPQGSSPTSDNPAVTAITATSANGDDPTWQAFLTNGQAFTVQVTAPQNAQPGDDLVVTINLAGFDSQGQNIDSGVGVVTFTVEDDTGNTDCLPVTRNIGNQAISLFAGDFRDVTTANYITITGLSNVTPATNDITLNTNLAQGRIDVALALPDGTYTADVRVETAAGVFCDTTLTIVKDTNGGGAFNCADPANRTITFGTPVTTAATQFNGDALTIDSFQVVPDVGAHATIDSSGNADVLVFDNTTPAGTYTVTVTVQNAAQDSCTGSFTITVNEQVPTGPNIVNCASLEWVNGRPTIECGFTQTAELLLTNVNGNPLNVPIENVSVVSTDTSVTTTVTANLGNGIYTVQFDATDAACTGATTANVRVSAIA